MAWHVASRHELPWGMAEPLAAPLDLEYAASKHKSTWWRPANRLGQLSPPPPMSPRVLALPPIVAPPVTPRYEPMRSMLAVPTLREHIFSVRGFQQVSVPPGELIGSPVAAMSMSNPRLAYERGLKIPRTPIYDDPSVSGFFGPAH